jgi:XTP/dITP diphosphohydrolase
MKAVLASKNKNKAREIAEILGDSWKIATLDELKINCDVVENGATFEDNAIKKAAEIMKIASLPTIADDSGLEVDFLGGAPGIFTARYASANATDDENIDKILRELSGVPPEKRGAKFVCVIAFALPEKKILTFRGECSGKILTKRSGENGFGYDPIFAPDGFGGRSMAELTSAEKNGASHRAAALEKMKRY